MEGSPAQGKGRFPIPFNRVYYGWWVVFGASTIGATWAGLYYFSLAAFLGPISEEFHLPRRTISLVIGLSSLIQGVCISPLVGVVVDRYGPRRVIFVGVTLMGLGFILISTAPNITLLVLYFILFLSVGSAEQTGPAMAAVANWFVKRRGTAIGITNTAIGLGALLVSVTTLLIDSFTWRGAALAIGIIMWVVGYPIALLIRHRPEQYGLLPDGATEAPVEATPQDPQGGEIHFTPREALASRAFWLIYIAFGLRSFVSLGTTLHLVLAMEEKGFSTATGAALLGLLGLIGLPGRLFSGVLADRVNKRLVASGSIALMGLGALMFAWSTSLWQIVLCVAVFATGMGGSGTLGSTITGEYFGRKAFATIAGMGAVISGIGLAGGPYLAGFSYDVTGSYRFAFLTFTAVGGVAAAAMFMAKRPIPRRLRRLSPAGV